MFDNYTIGRPPVVHVHNDIKQQPNDAADSARLFGELKDKAEKEVAAAAVERLGADNIVKVLRVDAERSYATQDVSTRVLFSVNGVQFDIRDTTPETWREQVLDIVARAVMAKVMAALKQPLR